MQRMQLCNPNIYAIHSFKLGYFMNQIHTTIKQDRVKMWKCDVTFNDYLLRAGSTEPVFST